MAAAADHDGGGTAQNAPARKRTSRKTAANASGKAPARSAYRTAKPAYDGADASADEGFEVTEVEAADAPADLDDQSTAMGDSVHTYLKAIGRRQLLTAEQEVDLAKRIEAGLYAEHKLEAGGLSPACAPTWSGSPPTAAVPRPTCWRPTSGSWCRSPRSTPTAACRCWTSSRRATSA